MAFKVLGQFYKIEYLKNLAETLSDPHGKGFDGYSESAELGLNTYNYGIVSYAGNVLKLTVDFRYGESADPIKCMKNFETATKMNAALLSEAKPLLFDKKSPLVSTLMKSYKRMTFQFFDKPMAIGGGTYAKEAKNCVAYGSAFKDHPGDIHSPNEYIYIDDLTKQIAIYADAIYRLGHIKA